MASIETRCDVVEDDEARRSVVSASGRKKNSSRNRIPIALGKYSAGVDVVEPVEV